MDREVFAERLLALQQSEKEAWANLNALIGARMECEYWLDQFDVEPEEPVEE